jgi:hypothetical protein
VNYARALATLHHARTGKLLEKKKLENATWLHLVHVAREPYCVDLVPFDKHILTWYPNDSIAIDNCGYWAWTTKDRLNKYMPSGFRVWQTRPYWFIKTPRAVLPFRNGMHLDACGGNMALPNQVHVVGAHGMQEKVRAYAKAYAARLVDGKISREPYCTLCTTANNLELPMEKRLHLLTHMSLDEFPGEIVIEAMRRTVPGDKYHFHQGERFGSSFLADLVFASWKEVQVFWRKTTSRKALIEQVEQRMTTSLVISFPPGGPKERPRKYITNFRMMIEDFLLEYVVGFERMTE